MRSSELSRVWAVFSALSMLLVHLVFRVRIEGLEHVPSDGSAILAFNHVSVLDGPVLAIEVARRRRRETRFLVASEVSRTRLWGPVLRAFDQIPIRRGEGDGAALDEAIDTIRRGAIVAIAPEGRVTDDPRAGLQRMHTGVARLALPTGAQIVPVGIWGTQARWTKSGPRLRPPWRPRAAVVFGRPFPAVGDAANADDVDAFVTHVGEAIQTQVTRARAAAGDG